jgi:hypothetical protein
MTQQVFLVITCRDEPQVFATHELAVQSLKFSFHAIPDMLEELVEGVRYKDKRNDEIIDIVDTIVHNMIVHL